MFGNFGDMSAGRPTSYNQDKADEICEILANTTLGLNSICRREDMPNRTTVYRWIENFPEFRNKYARAKEMQAELMAEEIVDISDDESRDTLTINKGDATIEIPNVEWIQRARLRVDSRKWLMSKLLPKKFGDKIEFSGDKENPIVTKNEHRFIVEDMRDGSETKL